MNPVQIEGGRPLGAPAGWDPEKHGNCETLSVVDLIACNAHCIASFWKPTPEELEALNGGGMVVFRIMGTTHAPMWIGALPNDGFAHT